MIFDPKTLHLPFFLGKIGILLKNSELPFLPTL